MRLHLLLVSSILLTPLPSNADVYRFGYTSEHSCFKTIYREEYVPGNEFSPGFVKYFKEQIEIPCTSQRWRSASRYKHYQHLRRKDGLRTHRNSYISNQEQQRCSNASSKTTGGLLGGGLAAVLSKKESYGWSIPLGAVLGMGIASADC